MAWNDLLIRDAVFSLVTGPAATVYAGLGALVVRRARNPIGWFLLGDGGFLAIMALSSAYAVRESAILGPCPRPQPRGCWPSGASSGDRGGVHLRLNWLWTGLHLGIAVYGVVLAIITGLTR